MIGRFVFTTAVALALVGCGSTRADIQSIGQDQTVLAAAPDSSASATPAASSAPADGSPAPAAIETAAIHTQAWRIGPEDVLDIYVRNDRELSRPAVPVRPDGKISLPLVNDVHAAGLTTDELRLRLMEEFKRYFENPEVSVSMKEMHSFKVSVQGNVRMPGQYEVRSQQTVLELLSRAQGFNEFADKGSIRVVRRANGRDEAIRFRYNDAINARDGANFAVQPGDIIIVD
jgi:polysaccharide export outer membrane protein